eukprot:scaffold33152_cov67-Phaeocystis_antarctica.AAC.1
MVAAEATAAATAATAAAAAASISAPARSRRFTQTWARRRAGGRPRSNRCTAPRNGCRRAGWLSPTGSPTGATHSGPPA